jgi:Zn-dependent oligopeptidase
MARLLEVNGGDFEIWDWRYLTQRLLREEYQIDSFAVAEYFPLDAVLEGLFDVYQGLTGVRFVPQIDAHTWHPDVRFFDIQDDESGAIVAHFYMDLHPRPDKFGHAAAFTLQGGRAQPDGQGYQAPVSAIVANFTKPTETTPSLLQHSEVVTLFHEFGHILHQTLTRARFMRFSGTSVERDFVEAPSQMLEHWCWQPEVLRGFTRHHRTGEPIPEDLVERMIAAKNVSSGIAILRQIYFSRLDMAYHGPGAAKDTDAIARVIHPITGFPFPEGTHFQAGFGHLFGYDAGYYGYLWSKVSGDDMFTRFEEAGLPAHEVGRAYRRGILERGGTVNGEALVREFLGRDPSPDAFLRDLGLVAESDSARDGGR